MELILELSLRMLRLQWVAHNIRIARLHSFLIRRDQAALQEKILGTANWRRKTLRTLLIFVAATVPALAQTFTALAHFTTIAAGSPSPYAPLIQGADGNL
jgi:hypothetical protein